MVTNEHLVLDIEVSPGPGRLLQLLLYSVEYFGYREVPSTGNSCHLPWDKNCPLEGLIFLLSKQRELRSDN